jgi:hypothetical protein
MNPTTLRQLIQTTLTPLNLYSENVEELLMFTAANESHLGVYRHQINGPALGIFQMEPATHADIWSNFLRYRTPLQHLLQPCDSDRLENDDPYAIALARCQYLRAPEAIPDKGDIEGIWNLYKLRYNTPLGAATHDEAMACYNKYVLEQ